MDETPAIDKAVAETLAFAREIPAFLEYRATCTPPRVASVAPNWELFQWLDFLIELGFGNVNQNGIGILEIESAIAARAHGITLVEIEVGENVAPMEPLEPLEPVRQRVPRERSANFTRQVVFKRERVRRAG